MKIIACQSRHRTSTWWWTGLMVVSLCRLSIPRADEPVFSGPQPGESLPPFVVRGVLDADAGMDLDFVAKANGGPLLLIFVHDVNRQSIAMTRVLSQYTSERTDGDLVTGVIMLDDDATAAESIVKRIRHALAPKAPIGVSIDGKEGPGSYGLNRKVMLTILVGNKGLVTDNFALIQPSLQADLPTILERVVAVAGGTVPKLEDLAGMREMTRGQSKRDASKTGEGLNLRPLLQPLIQRDAKPEDVDKAAAKVEELAEKDNAVRKEIGRIANTIIDAGKLTDYGTPRCQEYLQKWATAYGMPRTGTDPATDPDLEKPAPESVPDKADEK